MSNCRSIFGINVTKLKHYLFAVAFRVGVLYNISTQRERVLITRFEPPNLSPLGGRGSTFPCLSDNAPVSFGQQFDAAPFARDNVPD